MKGLKDLLIPSITFRPFAQHWAHEAFLTQNSMHWMSTEIDFSKDKMDYEYKGTDVNQLTDLEKKILLRTLMFFTQMDVEVGRCYIHIFCRYFRNLEVQRMLVSFAAIEQIHAEAYNKLLQVLQIPADTDKAFLNIKEMMEKYDYLTAISPENMTDLLNNRESQLIMARIICIVSAAFEGFVLYSSFAILFAYSHRRSQYGGPKLIGVGQVVEWSMRDESHHAHSMIRLFLEFCKAAAFDKKTMDDIEKYAHQEFRKLVELENKFIDFVFNGESLPYLTPTEVKDYIKYLANVRLNQLHMTPIFTDCKGNLILQNPLDYMEEVLKYKERTNFFDSTPTEYQRNLNYEGIEDAYDEIKNEIKNDAQKAK